MMNLCRGAIVDTCVAKSTLLLPHRNTVPRPEENIRSAPSDTNPKYITDLWDEGSLLHYSKFTDVKMVRRT